MAKHAAHQHVLLAADYHKQAAAEYMKAAGAYEEEDERGAAHHILMAGTHASRAGANASEAMKMHAILNTPVNDTVGNE